MRIITIWSVLALIIFASLIISGCIAAPADDQKNGGRGGFGGHMIENLQNLTAKGYDVTQIQAAVDKGDNQTAFTLLNQLYDQHPEARPPMPLDRIKNTVVNLTAKGYDISSIQTAIDSGDASKATTALNDFWKAHPEARPTPRPPRQT